MQSGRVYFVFNGDNTKFWECIAIGQVHTLVHRGNTRPSGHVAKDWLCLFPWYVMILSAWSLMFDTWKLAGQELFLLLLLFFFSHSIRGWNNSFPFFLTHSYKEICKWSDHEIDKIVRRTLLISHPPDHYQSKQWAGDCTVNDSMCRPRCWRVPASCCLTPPAQLACICRLLVPSKPPNQQ